MFVKVLDEDLWINVTRIFELRIESGSGDYDYSVIATYETPSNWGAKPIFRSSKEACQDYINSLFTLPQKGV